MVIDLAGGSVCLEVGCQLMNDDWLQGYSVLYRDVKSERCKADAMQRAQCLADMHSACSPNYLRLSLVF